jgi:hypothetical protein
MFLRKTSLICCLIIAVLAAKAQSSVGLEPGLTGGYLNTNLSNRESSVMAYRLGYSVAIPFEYKLNDWLSLETDPGIMQKNYSINRTDSLEGAYTSFINTYFQLPVMAKFMYGNKLKFFANAGFFYGYWLAAKERGKMPDIFSATETGNGSGQATSTIQYAGFDQKYPLNNTIDNRSELGWLVGAGVQKQFRQQYIVYASLRLYESLSQQQKNYILGQIPQYNEVLSFSMGAMYLLK